MLVYSFYLVSVKLFIHISQVMRTCLVSAIFPVLTVWFIDWNLLEENKLIRVISLLGHSHLLDICEARNVSNPPLRRRAIQIWP